MPRFIKGSEEAKKFMEMIRSKKKQTEKKEPNPNKGIRNKNKNTKVNIPLMNTQEIAVPEFFATPNKNGYKLVNPLTKSRNLSNRDGKPSIKILRKPIENMVIMEHSTEPISLSKFSKKDREVINKHFPIVESHKDKDIKDVPLSNPFENKERGRPEVLHRNILINKERKKKAKEEEKKEENNPTKRRYIKHQTEEERLEFIRKSKREYARKKRAEMKGLGFLDDIKNFGKKAVNKVVDTAKNISHKVEDYANVVLNGRNDYPPKVRNILSKKGNQTITSMIIGRTPVPSILTNALSIVSGGEFGKNLKNSPYDTLFHLFLRCELDDGTTVNIEKNEVINMDIDAPIPDKTQTKPIIQLPEGLSIITILDNAHKIQGGKFFVYSARDNNCQDFILAILNGSNIGNEEDRAFVKQDTKELFGSNSGLRKISNTITDLGAKVNEITTGRGVNYKDSDSDSDSEIDGKGIKDYMIQSVLFDKGKYNIKEAKKWLKENGYKSPKVDTTEDKHRFRQISPKTVEKKGYNIFRNKKLGKSGIELIIAYKGKKKNNISTNIIMPRKMKGGAIIDGMVPVNTIRNRINLQSMRGSGLGTGLYAGGNGIHNDHIVGGQLGDGIHHHHYHHTEIDGEGRIHHHHHHHIDGGRLSGIADDLDKAFNPKRNGIQKAVQQNIVNPINNNIVKPAQNALSEQNVVNGLKVAGHYAIPAITSGLGGLAGGVLGTALDPTGGEVLGGIAGSALGAYGGQQINKALGIENATGTGLKKGSKEMKEKMARIRAMKRK